MAVRTSPDAVKDVLSPGDDYKPGKPIEPFITAANNIVNWIQVNATRYGRTAMDDAGALGLETWLAAWAYKASDQQYQSSNAGQSSATFRGQSGMGLEMNNYGQAALVMDTSGMLRALNSGAVVGVGWLGKTLDEMFTYNERNPVRTM